MNHCSEAYRRYASFGNFFATLTLSYITKRVPREYWQHTTDKLTERYDTGTNSLPFAWHCQCLSVLLHSTFIFIIFYMAKVIIKTTEGDIAVRLYDETPQHRDNFIKLAKEGYFDGTLFHRVIKDFMIQGGDPDSKGAPKGKMLGTGGPDYTIPAEFVYPQLFHKRGALSAARLGDEVNPNRESSGSQFYIVWGKTYKPNELKQMEKQMGMQMEQTVFNQLAKEHHDEIMNFRRNRDRQGLMALQDQLVEETKKHCKAQGYPKFTDEQVKAYTEVGGTPFLDNQYTVFGEVEDGLDVVEKIQNCETLRGDRPKEDISMSIEVIEE